VRKGFRVAICEQTEDPRKAKGVVKREVVRVVSPGTLTDTNYLDAREPAFLLAVSTAGPTIGVALLDLSTGEFTAAEYAGADGMQALADEIAVLRPREIVVPESGNGSRSSTLPAAANGAALRRVVAGPGGCAGVGAAADASRGLDLRRRGRAPPAARPAPRRWARRLR